MAVRTWRSRRRAGLAAFSAAAIALSSGLLVPTAARAQSVGSLRAQAAQLEAQIQQLGQQEAALSERYDGANYALSQTQAKVAAARSALRQALAKAGHARGVLQTEALDAYVSGSGGSPALTPLKSADQSLLRAEYEQTLANNQTDAMDAYQAASLQASTAERLLHQQEKAQTADLRAIAGDKVKVQAAADQLQQLLGHDKGQIATLVAAQQAAQRRAQERAAQLRIQQQQQQQRQAAARAAAAAAAAATTTTTAPPATPPVVGSTSGSGSTSGGSGSGGSGSGGSGFTPPPSSSAAAVAVAAAESRVGDPYVWGAAGPNAFDCSGLVMWAYAQAGISLPHFSGAQYADTVHIPMSALQPGDLVFFSNPGEHVAMYVGNGMIIQAPYTGAFVEIVPMYPGFTLASRVE